MKRVYGIQFDLVWEDQSTNHQLVEDLLERTGPEVGSLVVLPELFDVGFTLNTGELCEETTGGASESWCADLARRLGVYVQGASIRRVSDDVKATNNAVVFDPDGDVICRYQKVFPFSGGREPECYQAGTGLNVFEWNGLTVCPLICYDLRFPELWRLAVLDCGAEMFTIGASWPSTRHDHWLRLLEARAIENQAWVVGVNRCGSDPHLEYAGGSKIVDPKGRVLVEGDDTVNVISHEIDAEAVREWRESFGVLRDAHRTMLGRVGPTD